MEMVSALNTSSQVPGPPFSCQPFAVAHALSAVPAVPAVAVEKKLIFCFPGGEGQALGGCGATWAHFMCPSLACLSLQAGSAGAEMC